MKLEPGRELDALVAEKVMGLENVKFQPLRTKKIPGGNNFLIINEDLYYGCGELEKQVPTYSTDIISAWEIVEKLKHLEPELTWSDEHQCWHMTLWKGANQGMMPGSKTAPHAICLAALKAVGALCVS